MSKSSKGTTRSRWYRKAKARFKAECEAEDRRCWLCGMPIDYSIPWSDPVTGKVNNDAFELDHLYPRSTHPELAEDYANFRPSHRACNGQRSNKLSTGSGIGRLSRQWTK